ITEVVETTNEVHGMVEGMRLLGQGAGASGERMESSPEGGIEAFDSSAVLRTSVGSIDDTRDALAGLTQAGGYRNFLVFWDFAWYGFFPHSI
ncbi:MAG: hypothetical protein GY762_13360, partial [Proteobacteria bacterium]|nr:hypothetical protein [Pseudomonadota bacterium]